MCRGTQQQIKADNARQFLLMSVDQDVEDDGQSLKRTERDLKKKYKMVGESNEDELEVAWDDVPGAELNPKAVRKARQEEIECVRKMSVYEKILVSEYIKRTSRQPISVRWIDKNKGDDANQIYRSRLAAPEINIHKRDDFFAATPPLEAMKAVLSMTAIANKGEILMVNDIRKVFFHARAKRDVYVQLAEEDRGPNEEGLCGKLRYSMYGTRDVAQNWLEEYSSQLCSVGFRQGRATAYVFYHPERRMRTMLHGDDYISTGMPKELERMKRQTENKCTVKTQLLGPGPGETKQVKIINRIITWDGKQCIIYEVDPRHVEIVVKQLQLNDAKPVTTPGTKEEGRTQEGMDTSLDQEGASRYRALVA